MSLILTIFVIGIMWINYPLTADALPVSLSPNVVLNLNSSVMKQENEIWKDVIGYEGRYQVSSFGNVRSLDMRVRHVCRDGSESHRVIKGRVFKKCYQTNGYEIVVFSVKNKHKTRTVHQLVAESFLKHKRNGICGIVVNHIDFDKKNNNLGNLELVTQRKNSNQKHIPSTSEHVGVSWDKRKHKWASQIVFNKKTILLGLFNDELEASAYYLNALKSISDGIKIKRKPTSKTSIYKGVYLNKNNNKWHASIMIKGKKEHLGYFNIEYDAHMSYQNRLKENKQKS